ncbi:hypothetical protein NFHSH190041_01410 [Shewanella sp. NFH-SH190041]|uniref:hypothetical protein n=1 Tax=Shewanella sp. NFH-SH190041 TaxID=2950245 RepID=UPI0021C4456F|nr:hypothetical protein [Shewanella sp. NFH-SH190041]BDM62689.1 hypothetical protein NFHSH190041_01410 [Shewanella sp. NFH-SH190041]
MKNEAEEPETTNGEINNIKTQKNKVKPYDLILMNEEIIDSIILINPTRTKIDKEKK